MVFHPFRGRWSGTLSKSFCASHSMFVRWMIMNRIRGTDDLEGEGWPSDQLSQSIGIRLCLFSFLIIIEHRNVIRWRWTWMNRFESNRIDKGIWTIKPNHKINNLKIYYTQLRSTKKETIEEEWTGSTDTCTQMKNQCEPSAVFRVAHLTENNKWVTTNAQTILCRLYVVADDGDEKFERKPVHIHVVPSTLFWMNQKIFETKQDDKLGITCNSLQYDDREISETYTHTHSPACLRRANRCPRAHSIRTLTAHTTTHIAYASGIERSEVIIWFRCFYLLVTSSSSSSTSSSRIFFLFIFSICCCDDDFVHDMVVLLLHNAYAECVRSSIWTNSVHCISLKVSDT